MSKECILLTDIGGDVDDVLTLLVLSVMHKAQNARLLAVMTTHIAPLEKAKIAKMILTESGLADIPVYAGVGCERHEAREVFLQQNPLFPAKYGFPAANAGEKQWHPKQGLAYREIFGERFEQSAVEKQTAASALVALAREYSPENKLTVIAIGPLHDLDAALNLAPEIAKNIEVVAMGGLYPDGYNWLIAPQVTARVLAQVKVTCITAEFIRANQLFISKAELETLQLNVKTDLGRAVLQDWINWHAANVNQKTHTNLYDPTTACLATLFSDQILSAMMKQVSFPCIDPQGALKPEFVGSNYAQPGMEGKIISAQDAEQGNVAVVQTVKSPELIREYMLTSIAAGLGIVMPEKKASAADSGFFAKSTSSSMHAVASTAYDSPAL